MGVCHLQLIFSAKENCCACNAPSDAGDSLLSSHFQPCFDLVIETLDPLGVVDVDRALLGIVARLLLSL